MYIFKAAVVAATIVTGLGLSTAHAVDAKMLAQSAEPMSVYELYVMYQNKSWLWESGAGYFANKERRFLAWSGSQASPTYAEGRWFIPEGGGKVCFKAVWYYREGSKSKKSCFSHRKNGAAILQRREPDGDWYVFRSPASTAADAFSKLKHGDYVTAKLERRRAALGKN
jgi:hypothetical protein